MTKTMTMKRRIFISNTAMVLVSLLILFGTFGCIFGLFKKEFMEGGEQEDRLSDYHVCVLSNVSERLARVQSHLKRYERLTNAAYLALVRELRCTRILAAGSHGLRNTISSRKKNGCRALSSTAKGRRNSPGRRNGDGMGLSKG